MRLEILRQMSDDELNLLKKLCLSRIGALYYRIGNPMFGETKEIRAEILALKNMELNILNIMEERKLPKDEAIFYE